MFEVGECIVYGLNGICRVTEVGPSPYDATDTRTYYTLVPLHNPSGTTIFTPVDNARVPMRRLMTGEQIESLIRSIPRIGTLEITEERRRRDVYRDTVNTLEPEGYVRVMNTVRERRAALAAAHKHFPVSDLEYGRIATHLLYSECAYVLGIEEASVEAYIADLIGRAE